MLHGDPLLLKTRESLLTGVFGLVCLASLAAPGPVMFYLARAFATGGDAGQAAEFDKRWQLPTVPGRFRISTAAWGICLTGEAAIRTVLAVNVSTQLFLILSQVISWTVLDGLLWFSRPLQPGRRAPPDRLDPGSPGSRTFPHGQPPVYGLAAAIARRDRQRPGPGKLARQHNGRPCTHDRLMAPAQPQRPRRFPRSAPARPAYGASGQARCSRLVASVL